MKLEPGFEAEYRKWEYDFVKSTVTEARELRR